MSTNGKISLLFAVGAAYDAVLGVAFLCGAPWILSRFNIPPPNHYGYIHFPSALLIIFALMFAAIARDPVRNRNLIPYGILMKVAYAGVVFGYWFTAAGIPNLWKPFALCDAGFAILFAMAWMSKPVTKPEAAPEMSRVG